jgi:ADP-L-glycero-D-manno-heptose 6-epimerase
MKENVIITGTEGFIGSSLKRELSKKYEVFEINENILDSHTWKDDLLSLFKTIKYVFHVGACSDTLETDVNYMMIRNYEFSVHLSDICALRKIPMIYSSSAANYGTNGLHPSNLYGWSKYAAENIVVKNGGIALRYFNVYGPGEEHKGRMASVAFQMHQKHQLQEKIYLFPKKPKRDFVYIKDVVSANLYAARHFDKLLGNYYEVGSGKAEAFESVLDELQIPYEYTLESSIPNGYQFFTQSKDKFWMEGWKPDFNLQRGLKEYKEYLCSEGHEA